MSRGKHQKKMTHVRQERESERVASLKTELKNANEEIVRLRVTKEEHSAALTEIARLQAIVDGSTAPQVSRLEDLVSEMANALNEMRAYQNKVRRHWEKIGDEILPMLHERGDRPDETMSRFVSLLEDKESMIVMDEHWAKLPPEVANVLNKKSRYSG